ncbi:MAG TPA: DUF5666 domain-containing protein [Mycobacteriales bacterium]|nr:DUF5666 domain-containing protein [Mycobacteriales bacterium]
MKAGMKTALRTVAWSTSAVLMIGAAAGTATAAAHKHHKKHAKAAASDTTSSDSQTARPKMLHDLATVETSDGTFEQYASQFGKVSAVSDTSITVVSADEYSATYVIDDDTVVFKDGDKATTADIATGDKVMVRAEDEDGSFTAEVIGDGKPPAGGRPGGPGAGGPGAGGRGPGGSPSGGAPGGEQSGAPGIDDNS